MRSWRIRGLGRPWRDRLRGRGPSPHPGLYGWSHTTPPKKSLEEVEADLGWRSGGAGIGGRSGGAGTAKRFRGAGTGGRSGLEGVADDGGVFPTDGGLAEPRTAACLREPQMAALISPQTAAD